MHTKALLLEHVATRRAYLEITRQELQVQVFGDTAILTGGIVNRMRAPRAASGSSTASSPRCCTAAPTARGDSSASR